MKVKKGSIDGNSNIGLYGVPTDKYILVGELPFEEKELAELFSKEIKQITIAGTKLIGVFICANSNGLIVPGITFDDEIKKLEDLGYKVTVIDTKLTCLGNNIFSNNEVAFVNPEFTNEEIEQIEKGLGLKAVRKQIGGAETPGSMAVINDKGCLVTHNASDEELDRIRKEFNIKTDKGSVNFGSPMVRSGIIANNVGMLIGEDSGGPEIVQADRILGTMDE